MRTLLALLVAGIATASSAAIVPPRTALLRAQAEARAAEQRVRGLEGQARVATTRATRARAAQAAAVARIAAAEAGITAATARIRIVEAARGSQRARLAAIERPAATLLAGLQTLARRPPALALVQRGSLNDLVHTRALLASTLPAIAARTQGLRAELAAAARIEGRATAAATALRASRADLDVQRRALARIEATAMRQSQTYVDSALDEGDRALSLGEDARTIVSQSRQRQADAAIVAVLARLPGPSLRPGTAARPPRDGRRPAYLLPVEGRVLTGAGEISAAGVHARGLTVESASGAAILSPAAGRIVYAAPFRSFGRIVIIDHGAGWTTTITDLASLDVAAGTIVARADTLGRAPRGRPAITIELRHAGRPVPIAPLL